MALDHSRRIADSRAETYAAGYLGRLHSRSGRHAAASPLLERALSVALRANVPDAVFQWNWELGRLHAAQNENVKARRAYEEAVQAFQPLLRDWILGQPNRPGIGSFREEVGGLYLEYTDLLLREARTEPDPAQKQVALRNVRETLEQLKSGEMESYFQDECGPADRKRSSNIDELDPHTAILYVVPLPDRTELLLAIKGELQSIQSPTSETELTAIVRDFRRKLEKRTTREFLGPAQKLYSILIQPITEELQKQQINTLVFVPDASLRTIPVSAFHDGKDFLIRHYAVAVSPGMSLMDPKPLRTGRANILLNGLSKSVQGFPALDFVPAELEQVRSLHGGRVLLDDQFVNQKVETEFSKAAYSVVHIASHAEFAGDSRKSFLLTYDGKLNLDQIDQAIRPSQYRGRPVELLALSACQTAAGDDRAALGLAGVALKAGARSALATLWFVNDQASSKLVSEFYRQLTSKAAPSKAVALQQAQLSLIDNPQYAHPSYWSPYLLIGNWL